MSENATARGLLLPCPRCMTHDASVRLHLDDGETFTCAECEEDFEVADIRALMSAWEPVLAWMDTMPQAS